MPPPGPEMPDEMADYRRRLDLACRWADQLEEIADRLAATSADWMAVEEYRTWKETRPF